MDDTVNVMCEVLAWKCGIFYFGHSILRGLARFVGLLEHKLVNHTFFCSVVCCLACTILAIGMTFEKEWSWKVDPICAIILGVLCIIEGMRISYVWLDDVDHLLTQHSRP